jgi:hypothetical protein
MKKECIVLIYNSFKDPLFQNLMYRYILDLTTHTAWTFHLITYEQPAFEVHDKKCLKKELRKQRVYWYPKAHRTGRLLVIKKALDGISSLFLVLRLRLKGVRVIWSFANLAASLGFIYSRLFGLKTIIYSFEPHSQFMLELGLWNAHSIKYKTLNFLEWRSGLEANYVLTGTKYMVEELRTRKAKGKIFRAPTSVDEKVFIIDKQVRQEYRRKLNLEGKKVLIYLGKFGGLYYDKEIYHLLKVLDSHIENMFFLIATPDEPEEVKSNLYAAGIEDNFKVSHLLNVKDVVGYLNAADIGLNAIPPTPSQKYRSPTKVAEYLLCGLPYITCKGISEDDVKANSYKVGVVLDSFEKDEVLIKLTELEKIMESRLILAEFYRRIGLEYRSRVRIIEYLKVIFEELS